MKPTFIILLFFVCIGHSNNLLAVNIATGPYTIENYSKGTSITVNDFLSLDSKEIRTPDGKKLSWTKRLGMKMTQKHLAGQVRKGKIDGGADLHAAMKAASANKKGLYSLIFSSLGLIFLFIPYVAILGLGLSIAGFVLGIIGLKRDEDTTMALLGVILGGVALFIYLLVIVAIAAWFSWF